MMDLKFEHETKMYGDGSILLTTTCTNYSHPISTSYMVQSDEYLDRAKKEAEWQLRSLILKSVK